LSKKRIFKSIKSFEKLILEHEEKIAKEKSKPIPNTGLMKYWEREMLIYKEEIVKANRRLKRGR
jgi:hypothetical protein